MCIIAKLLKLPFLLNCWERLYVKVTPILDGAYKPVSTTSPMYTLHRKWRFGKLNLHWHTLTVGMRRVVIWEAEDDFFRDLNGWSLSSPQCTRGQSPAPLGQTCLVSETIAACVKACTPYTSYRLSIDISLSPTKNIWLIIIKQSHLKIILILHYTSYFTLILINSCKAAVALPFPD